jgi:lysozyme
MSCPSSFAAKSVSILILACASACSGGVSDDDASASSADELRSCAVGTTVKGIDVSSYQGAVNWSTVKAGGRPFAFARVSDGIKHPDKKFSADWNAMAAAGIIRGAYQYFRPKQSATAQADLFLQKIGTLGKDDLPPVIDVESADGLSSTKVRAGVQTWIKRVEAATGRRVMIYTAHFMSNVIGDGFGAQPLWVANYGVKCPSMPAGWTTWKFFQSSESGTVHGVGGKVDLDAFNGSLADLHQFIAESTIGGRPTGGGEDSGGDPTTDDTGQNEDPENPTVAGCHSDTLGTDVPPLTCVESAFNGNLYQCYDGKWYQADASGIGQYGPCESSESQ